MLKFRYGAEGGLNSDTLFLPVLQGVFNFLRKIANSMFRTDRTFGTVRTQLYLSCSSLCSNSSEFEGEPISM